MDRTKIKTCRLALILGAMLTLAFTGCAGDESGAPASLTGIQTCPPWVEFPEDHHSNADSPYLGCTNYVNLVNMLESPADLDQGRPLGPEDSARETVVLKNYDENISTPFKEINAPNAAPSTSATPEPAGGSSP